MLVLEMKTVYILMSNRYEGLLAQDHVQNMVALAEAQYNINKLKAIYSEPEQNQNQVMKMGPLNSMAQISYPHIQKAPAFGAGVNHVSSEDEDTKNQQDNQIKKKILKKHYEEILKSNKVWIWINEQLFEKQKLLSALYFKSFIEM
jgi:hypothetical protein